MGLVRASLAFFLAGCGAESVSVGCLLPFDDQPVCFDQDLSATCDGQALPSSCTDAGYTVAVESCEVRIAGTEGGFIEPGLCPRAVPGS